MGRQPRHPLPAAAGLLAAELGLVATLQRLGTVRWLTVKWADPLGWLARTPPEDALAALARAGALAVSWWLLASTLLCVAARLAGVPALVRGVDWLALPPVRRLADRAVAVSLSAVVTLAGPAGPAAVASEPFSPPPDARAVAAMANRDRARPRAGGRRLTTTRPAAPPAAAFSRAGVEVHVVRPGESLWSIATDRVAAGRDGSGPPPTAAVASYWSEVVRRVSGDLRSGDPDLLYPGERLRLPAAGR